MLRTRPRLHLLLIPLAAFLAVIPLLINGPSCGHDFEFHLLNWLEAARQISHGNLHPHWAQTPAWNAGEPRFVFYPPLSWTLGALLTLLLTHLPKFNQTNAFALAPILYTWLALTAGGLSLHALARRYTNPTAALLAAVFYLTNPYTLFTAFERTAFAELLAAAWIPLLFNAILPPPNDTPSTNISIPRLAIPLALLWLTNAPAAVMSSYALALILLVRLAHMWRSTHNHNLCLNLALRATAGTLLGLSLAAFYIVPAAYEQRWVQITMATIPGMRIQDNFLFGHAPPTTPDAPAHDAVLHTASLIAAILLVLTATLLIRLALQRSTRQPQASRVTLMALTSLTITITCLLLPISLLLWLHLPELAFLQFPWRLLALLACTCAWATGLALADLRLKPATSAIAALALAVLLIWPAYTTFRQGCDPQDTPQARLALFHSNHGTDPTDEYTPVTADNDALHPNNASFRLAPPNEIPNAPSNSPPAPTTGLSPTHLDLSPVTPKVLILNLRDYPAWQIHLNGTLVTARNQREDGLLAIPIPAGPDRIDITYARTPDQTIGDAISAVALLTLLLFSRQRLVSRAMKTR